MLYNLIAQLPPSLRDALLPLVPSRKVLGGALAGVAYFVLGEIGLPVTPGGTLDVLATIGVAFVVGFLLNEDTRIPAVSDKQPPADV